MPDEVCKRCRNHYSYSSEEWMMAEEIACLKLKEKMRREINRDETSHTEIIEGDDAA